MTPRLRKFALTMHISFSVGWLGAVVCFLALSVAAMKNQNLETVQALHFAMRVLALFVITPFAIASLLTGIIQSLGTEWGLFRHYWVLAKLVLTVFSTVILLTKLDLINQMALVAATEMLAANISER